MEVKQYIHIEKYEKQNLSDFTISHYLDKFFNLIYCTCGREHHQQQQNEYNVKGRKE